MKEWLTSKTIAFEDTDLKADLFAKIRDAAPNRKLFQTNDLAQRLGHIVLRSPVAHCELNPIELAWSKVKRYLKEHNQTFKLADLEELVPAASVCDSGDVEIVLQIRRKRRRKFLEKRWDAARPNGEICHHK